MTFEKAGPKQPGLFFCAEAIAGVRAAVTGTIDVGIKSRYFRTLRRMKFNDSASFAGVGAGNGGTAFINSSQHPSSHSLLVSVVYNFAPPPPPPPAPATQTCPDGSVIPATSTCPAPPSPRPPPPAQRG